MSNLYKTIPKEYTPTYFKLIHALADYGIEMIKDCKADCCTKNINVIKAKNIFDIALHLYDSSDTSESDALVDLVDEILEGIYKGVPTTFTMFSDTDNTLKLYLTVGTDDITLEINDADVTVYQELYDIN